MNRTSKPVSDRFQMNLVPALFILVIAVVLELVLYRLLGNMGFYIGVGTEGVRAIIADFSIFLMLFSGALSSILLFWAVARTVNHPNLPWMWWRGIMIFMSPLYLLSMFWSIWTPLSTWILLASQIAVGCTVVLMCIVSFLRPVSFGTRRLFGILAIIVLVASAKWIVLDFFQLNRMEKWGAFLLNAFEVVQFFMVLLPVFAFVLFVADTRQKWLENIRRPNLPALILSTLAAIMALFVVVLIQRITEGGNWMEAGQFVVRVSYRTIGLKLGWPFASIMAAVSLFFLGMTSLTLIWGRRNFKRIPGHREIGFGLLLVYLAGIQPFTVYQLSVSLLGILLVVIGVADGSPGITPSDAIADLQKELDG